MGSKMMKLAFVAPMLALALGTQHVSAQSTWTLKVPASAGTCAQGVPSSGSYGNSWSCNGAVVSGGTAAGLTVEASAWSTARGSDTYVYNGRYSSGLVSDSSYKTVFRPNGSGKYTWETYTSTGTVYASSNTSVISLSATQKSQAVLQEQVAPSASGTWFANAYMSSQGSAGFGASSRSEGYPATADSPDHSFDSVLPGGTDMVLLKFDKAVILSQFGMGWVTGDSDVSILRWTGDTGPTAADSAPVPAVGEKDNLSGTVGASGWKLVGHYGDVGTTTRSTGATEASSWWLISTYSSSLFGSATCTQFGSTSSDCDAGDDSFKINFLKTANYTCPNGGTTTSGGNCSSGDGTPAPEPGSLALAGCALAGLLGTRRRVLKSRS